VLATVIQLSKIRCGVGEREARRRLEDCTPSRFACQEPAVSRFRFLLLSVVSRTAQARSHSGVYHNFEPLSSPRSIAFLSTTFSSSEPRRFVAFQIVADFESLVKPSQSAVSQYLDSLPTTAQVAVTVRILPQPESVVKPSQYHVCESTRFSRSVCGFRARSPFPALTLVAYHNLERLSRPRSLAFLGLPFAVRGNREGFPLWPK